MRNIFSLTLKCQNVLLISYKAESPPHLQVAVQQRLGVGMQELHGKVNARQLPSGHRQVTWLGRPQGQDDCVVLAAQSLNGELAVHADVRVGHEIDALLLHQVHAALHNLGKKTSRWLERVVICLLL